jgi:hypothetical protein
MALRTDTTLSLASPLPTSLEPAPAATRPSRATPARLAGTSLDDALTAAQPSAVTEAEAPTSVAGGATAARAGFVGSLARLMTPASAAEEASRALHEAGAGVVALTARLLGPTSGAPEALDARAQALEDRAFEVLEVLTPAKVGAAEAALDVWLGGLEARSQRGERLEALEHLTLLHALKQGLLGKHEALAPDVARMEALLVASDQRLFGTTRALPDILEARLPRAYLRAQSADAKKIHDAVFATRDPSFTQALRELVQGHEPGVADAIAAAGLAGALFSGTGAQLLGGALHGYLLATLTEHVLHRHSAHISPSTKEKLDALTARMGAVGQAIRAFVEEMKFSHTNIHHGSYAGSYVDQFAPKDTGQTKAERDAQRAERRAKLEAAIDARGPKEAAGIRGSGYGVTLTSAVQDALMIAPVTALVTLLTGALAGQLGATAGAPFVAASVLASLAFLPLSNEVHPYLHMPREEALAKAGPLMRKFLESDYVSFIARTHYVHHHNARVNQNLLPGADFALGYQSPGVDTIVALRKLQTFY